MSEEVALAIGDIATVEQLRARILEWEDCYDRLAGAFDLHLAIGECQSALSDYAGGYYDVVIGDIQAEAEFWRIQASDVLTELHACEEEKTQLRKALDISLNQIDAEHDLTKALLIKMRRYFVSHGLLTGECVAWMHLKERYRIGESTEADAAWLEHYEQRKARGE